MSKNKALFKEKKSKKPDKALVEFSKTLHGKVMNHITKCLKDDNYFEGYIFSWALIDQVLLKGLINFIAKKLKVSVPSSLWNSNQQTINNFYLAISQDTTLYNELEKGRKNRNKFVHELIQKFNKDSIDKETRKAVKHVFLKIVEPMFERLTGKISIPSLNLYTKGWNDYRKEAMQIIKGK